jgi:hypothetical protein
VGGGAKQLCGTFLIVVIVLIVVLIVLIVTIKTISFDRFVIVLIVPRS